MKRKLLLVEDNRDFAEVIRKNFETQGWSVIHLGDGTQTLKVAREERPDAILLDIFLPEMDGFTALKTLKSKMDPETKEPSTVCNIPTVVMTGKAPMMEEMARFEGACEFVTKPVDFAALVKKIENIVRQKKGT